MFLVFAAAIDEITMAEPVQNTFEPDSAETALAQRPPCCTLLTELLARLAICSPEATDSGIVDALRQLAESLGADHAHLVLLSDGDSAQAVTHEWFGQELESRRGQPAAIQTRLWQWLEGRLKRGRPVVLSSLEDCPPEATEAHEFMADVGVRSWLEVPVDLGQGQFTYSVGLQSHADRTWSDRDVTHLRMLGDAVAGALARKRTEKALRNASAYHRGLIESCLDALVTLDANGRIGDANAAAEVATGYTKAGLIGRDYVECFTDPERARAVYDQALRHGSALEHALQLKHRDGSAKNVICHVSARTDSDGRTIGVIAVARDVTEKVRADAEPRQRDSLEAMIRDRTAELEAKNRSLTLEIAQRQRVEQALRESRERLQLQIDRMPLGCILWGQDLRVQSWNPAAEQIFGYSAQEALGKPTGDFMPPVSATSRMSSEWRKVILGDLKSRSEHVNVTKDGSRITCEWTNVPYCDPVGQVGGILSMVQDITERKRTAAEILRYSDELRDLYNNAPCAYHSLDEDARVVDINDTELKWLGYEREQVVGKMTFDQLLLPSSREAFRYDFAWLKLRGASRGVELDMLRQDGTVLPVLLTSTVLRDDAGRLVRSRSTAFDHSERKRAEAEARKLRRALAQSPAAVMITDTAGTIEYVNPTFSKITGYSEAEALGLNPRILKSGTHPAEFYRELWDTLLSGNEWRGELRNRKKNGELYWESTSISPIRDDSGRITHLVAVKEDATERKNLSQELTRAKDAAEAASRAKGAFLAHMSHEIRTPMNAILGFSQLMLRDSALTSQQREHLNAINRSGEHLLGLISNVLEMSKIEAGRASLKTGMCDLQALLDDLGVMFRERAEAKQLSCWLERVGTGPRFVLSDESKLRQVLINLLGNAVKFTREGVVALRLEVRSDPVKGARLVVEVEDTGPGIAPAELGRLFQSFEQTEAGRSLGGTGLGLAISREFARLMGGDLTVQSEVGRGSVFRLEVGVGPCAAEAEHTVLADLRLHRLRAGQPEYRVLIVDDEQENRVVLSRLLGSAGFVTVEMVNGLEALQEVERSRPAVVLMDLRMPVMDGYEAIRRIRARDPSVPIIAVSASAFSDDRHEAVALGASDFVTKPFRAEELFERLRAVLGVDYVYGEQAPTSCARTDGRVSVSSKNPIERSIRIPSELAAQIRRATANARWERLIELIGQLASEQPETATYLLELANAFEYDALLKVLDKPSTEQ